MATNLKTPAKPGDNGVPGRSVQQILAADAKAPPAVLNQESCAFLGSEDFSKDRYTSQAFHDLEMEKMWSKVWQMACREEDIPEVGDHVVYDIGDTSIIVMRSGEDQIKGFYNACLHRGTQLRPSDSQGSVPQLRCPFHGFTWDLKGSLIDVPCRWDFPHIKDEDFQLPEVKIGTWGGFVFINMDPDCESLEDYLSVIPEHFKGWSFEQRRKAVHVAKVVPCNWKVALEAFLEGFHVAMTHPEALPYTGDTNCQYDYWGENVSRMMSALGTTSPHLADFDYDEESIAEAMTAFIVGDLGDLSVPPGGTARQVLTKALGNMLGDATGVDHSDFATSEIIDAIQYYAFPNFVPWGGFGVPIVYRFRPNGHDPDSSIMEVMLLYMTSEDALAPPCPVHWLGPDELWTDALELGGLGAIFEQDAANFRRVQRGLKVDAKPSISLSNYQESRIRHYLQTLDSYLAR